MTKTFSEFHLPIVIAMNESTGKNTVRTQQSLLAVEPPSKGPKTRYFIYCLILLASALLVLLRYHELSKNRTFWKEQVAEKKALRDEYDKEIKAGKRFKAEKGELERKVAIIAEVEKKHAHMSTLVQRLMDFAPPSVRLHEISISGSRASIRIRVPDRAASTQLYDHMMESVMFARIDQKFIGENEKGLTFIIGADLSFDDNR
ncbi:hypothetical protein ACFLU6_08625 [Acidobacteriota bacterium]